MMFNRKSLIQAVEWSLNRQRQVWEERQAELKGLMEGERREWLVKNREHWQNAAEAIKLKLADYEPITEDDLPRYRGFISTFRPVRHPSQGEYEEDADLRALINVLETVEDDTVSMNALKNLGFGQRAMSNVVHSMALITQQQKESA